MLSKLARLKPITQLSPLVTGAARPSSLLNRAGRPLGRRLCSSQGNQKPPKGFKKYYEKEPTQTQSRGGKEAEAKEAKPSSKSGSQKGKNGKEPKPPEGSPQRQQVRLLLLTTAGVLTAMVVGQEKKPEGEEITLQELLRDYLTKGSVEWHSSESQAVNHRLGTHLSSTDKIQIVNKSFCRVHLRSDTTVTESSEVPSAGSAARTLIIQLGSPETFEAKLEQAQHDLGIPTVDYVPVQYIEESDWRSDILPHLPTALFVVLLFMGLSSMASMGASGMPGGPGAGPGGRNIFSIGKAFPQGAKDLKSKVKFPDVAGLDQAKSEVMEFVDFLQSPTKYQQLGARVPRGGLLVGPPGTGKTLLAKAVAGEADVPFFSMSGSDFIEMFVGVGPSRVRDLFQQARAQSPSIVFIDEIDAVGRRRGKGGFGGGGNDERENTLNQLLVEMDGFSSGTGVVVLAGTNRVDILDPALTRPGRFDRQIAIEKPDLAEREQIFMVHLKPINLQEGLAVEDVAKRMASLTPGFVGADIANVCNEAAIFAARRTAEHVEMQDFEQATERVLGGLPKQNGLMSPAEKKTVALHESGHAVAGWFLEHADPLLKVSIVPRSSGALGFAQYLPQEMSLFSKEAILDKIAVALGGRAAEDLFVKRITTGASDDLDKVTKMAYSMVAVYGMNAELGLVSYGQNNASEQFYKPYSEETGRKIDEQTKGIVEEQYSQVKALLAEQGEKLQALAERLAEKETLVYHDLVEVLGERPHPIKAELSKFATAGANPFTVQTATEVSEETSESAESKEE